MKCPRAIARVDVAELGRVKSIRLAVRQITALMNCVGGTALLRDGLPGTAVGVCQWWQDIACRLPGVSQARHDEQEDDLHPRCQLRGLYEEIQVVQMRRVTRRYSCLHCRPRN